MHAGHRGPKQTPKEKYETRMYGGRNVCMLVQIETSNRNLGADVALVRRALLASSLFNGGFTGTRRGGHGGRSDPEAVRGEFFGGWRGGQWLEYWVDRVAGEVPTISEDEKRGDRRCVVSLHHKVL